MKHYDARNYNIENSIGHLIGKLHLQMRKQLDEILAASDLTAAQWIVLMKLALYGHRNAAELADALNQDTGSMTRMLDRLEAKKLLRRIRSVEDRRVVELELTEEGQRLTPRLPVPAVECLNYALRDFTSAEVDQFQSYLKRMLAGIEGMPAMLTASLEKLA